MRLKCSIKNNRIEKVTSVIALIKIMVALTAISFGKVDNGIPLWKRYSLSVPEAARYFGIGETRLYRIIAEHPGADFILEI